MRAIFQTSALFVLLPGLALAETYTGVLIDAACAAQNKNARCNPTRSTTSFALIVAGKTLTTLKLDASGNTKAAAALKESENSANRSQDPNAPPSGSVTAIVMGAVSGDTLRVDSIRVD